MNSTQFHRTYKDSESIIHIHSLVNNFSISHEFFFNIKIRENCPWRRFSKYAYYIILSFSPYFTIQIILLMKYYIRLGRIGCVVIVSFIYINIKSIHLFNFRNFWKWKYIPMFAMSLKLRECLKFGWYLIEMLHTMIWLVFVTKYLFVKY